MFLYVIRNSGQDGLTLHEALSGISGSISLAAWIFFLVPQFVLNYRNKNANGISLTFLSVWTLGDLANLSGAVWASLVPTVVIIAMYFCFTDIILIAQTFYYNYLQTSRHRNKIAVTSTTDNEYTTLLASQPEADFPHLSTSATQQDDIEGKRIKSTSYLFDIKCFLGVIVIGSIGWIIAFYTRIWTPIPAPSQPSSPGIILNTPIGAQILGYMSAIFYLTARIPQIIKNYRQKSCEGLALLFFILSLLGNSTYGLSIIFHSSQKQYLVTNMPWLIGSLGTIVEDVIIFLQFCYYSGSQRLENS
ncbi:putative vacuolar membrane pq loop repeat protein [Erysiphe necator]|uniref:Putative vacuolar membrane pq loop repeat protein n=1 Tax=Uncinula necator TaxID=52586 RepID=A0A0B1P438_UNCNE|nr:putative vacuolar membrane pq loop repeat protein [Erysiphe necator]